MQHKTNKRREHQKLVINTTIWLFAKPNFSQKKKQKLQVSYYSINSLTKTLLNNSFWKTFDFTFFFSHYNCIRFAKYQNESATGIHDFTFFFSHYVILYSISQNNAPLNAVTLANGMVAVSDFSKKAEKYVHILF